LKSNETLITVDEFNKVVEQKNMNISVSISFRNEGSPAGHLDGMWEDGNK